MTLRYLFTLLWLSFALALMQISHAVAAPGEAPSARMWEQLIADAGRLHLPTRFLQHMPADFVRFEFDDLRTYAAEYHPGDHRLILDRRLSFNAAGRALKPLPKLTHKEVDVLYHELFHAYMDFLATSASDDSPLLSFARSQQACRYAAVAITPVVQRTDETEGRYLTESESWEALNETWAVFIGWAIWNELEVQKKGGGSMLEHSREADEWLLRFEQALQKGELRGYYVPEDPDERRVTQKRFLAKPSQISGGEVMVLMEQVLGFTNKLIQKMKTRPGLSVFFKKESDCPASARE